MAYFFDPNAGETHSTAQKKRMVADAMLRGAMNQGAPRNLGEGLSYFGRSIGAALAGRAANKAEATERETAASQRAENWGAIADIVNAMSGGGSYQPDAGTMSFGGGQQEFIDAMMPHAMEASQRTGVDPRIIVAQAAEESGWGKSAPGNNFFGIKSHGKGGGQNLATHEYVNGNRVNVNDSFRTYGSPGASVQGYADFILENPRYESFRTAQGLDAQLAALGQSGYATDPNYASSVGQIARSIPMGGQPVQVAQSGGFDPRIMELIDNPYLSGGQRQVLGAMLEQQLQGMMPPDPMKQLQMQKLQLELQGMRDGDQFTLSPGQTRFDASGNPIAEGGPDNKAPTVQKLKMDDGSEVAVQWDANTQQWAPINAPQGGGTAAPRNKLTESQSKLTLFQNLQTETQPILLDLENQFNPGNLPDAFARGVLGGNFLQTREGQIYNSAATAWAEGALRIATGAAATPEEMERTKRAYFAQPGDDPATISFKAQMREMYNRSIQKALGEKSVEGGLPMPSEFMERFAAPDENDGWTIEEVR